MIFKIRVSNSGKGRVVEKTTVPTTIASYAGYKCPYDLEYSDMNIVDYEVTFQGLVVHSGSGGSGGASCEPDNFIRLYNGAGVMYCKFPLSNTQQSAYQTPLLVTLQYGYMDSERKHIEIRNLRN
ncbi:MAG: hypothetical protein GXP63_06870 [DPANN group archaeon]|nr:hypothetical protein [DPANN group archaeon]